MRNRFSSSIALSAMMAVLAAPLAAQEATKTPAPATQTQQPAAQTAPVLPPELASAGLTDVTSKQGKRGETRIRGKLADGTVLDALVDPKGKLHGVRAKDKAALPAGLIADLVPQPVRDSAPYAEITTLEAVFMGQRGVMLAGKDAQDAPVRAAFAPDGTLLRFGRGPDAGPAFDRRGPGDDGPRGKGPGKHHHHRPGPGGRDAAPSPGNDRQGAAQQMQRDRDSVEQALTSAGYTQIGTVAKAGPRMVAQAVNPQGEKVSVELDANGQVLREVNR